MYGKGIDGLIDAAVEDGKLTRKEKQVLFKKAKAKNIDHDEFEIVLNARLAKQQKEEKKSTKASARRSDKLDDIHKGNVGKVILNWILSAICIVCVFPGILLLCFEPESIQLWVWILSLIAAIGGFCFGWVFWKYEVPPKWLWTKSTFELVRGKITNGFACAFSFFFVPIGINGIILLFFNN